MHDGSARTEGEGWPVESDDGGRTTEDVLTSRIRFGEQTRIDVHAVVEPGPSAWQ